VSCWHLITFPGPGRLAPSGTWYQAPLGTWHLLLVIVLLLSLAQAAYQPGDAGASWTEDEVSITRERIFAMISPVREDILTLYPSWESRSASQITEQALLRLSFHDCLRYEDGTGGCDGCLNWKGMYERAVGDCGEVGDCNRSKLPKLHTDNNDMSRIVKALEKVYKTTDWPPTYTGPAPQQSLRDSGKSRADLWAFAGWVALERSVERANHACEHDKFGRQQIPILEGPDKCDIKLTRVHKFRHGRKDCVPDEPDPELPYKTWKPEVQPKLMGTGEETVRFMEENFNMSAIEFIALSAVHSVVQARATLGTKYVWFGNAYISNMYHKMITNKPTYFIDTGTIVNAGKNKGEYGRKNATAQYFTYFGDSEGKPVARRGWVVNCQRQWNTTEGGPCFMRPTHEINRQDCFDGLDEEGRPTVYRGTVACQNVTIDENLAQRGGFGVSVNEAAFDGAFALPYEIGLYKQFEMSPVNYRPIGCPGIDMAYEDFPHKHQDDPLYGPGQSWTEPNECPLNMHNTSDGVLHEVTERLAEDHDLWAKHFLAAFEKMIQNGYDQEELQDGPVNSWFGHHTLSGRGDVFEDFEDYINSQVPMVITDPEADPYACSHDGGSSYKCGYKFSDVDAFAKVQYSAPMHEEQDEF